MPAAPMNEAKPLTLRAVAPYVLAALLLSMGPYLAAWLFPPDGMQFTGALVNHNDISVYLSALRQGAAGGWLYQLTFAPEPWQPRLMLLFYMLAGKLLPPVNGYYPIFFNLLQAVGVMAASLALLAWVRTALPQRPRQQRTAFLLILFGGGLGWLAWPLLAARVPGVFFLLPDIGSSELTAVTIFMGPAHFSFGLALELLLFVCVIRMTPPPRGLLWASAAALLALALAMTYVYHIATVILVIGAYLLLLTWRQRRIPWRLWGYGALIWGPLLPLLYYYGVWLNQEAVWLAYTQSAANQIPPPPWWAMLLGVGLPGALALLGGWKWLKDGQPPLVLVWFLVNLLAIYLPGISNSARLMMGWIAPLGTLAAYGLEEVVLPWYARRRAAQRWSPAAARRLILWMVFPVVLMMPLVRAASAFVQAEYPFYLPAAEIAAINWLAEQTTADDLILASYPISNYYPAVGRSRVFAGQLGYTTDLPGKLAVIARFWDAQTAEAERAALLRQWGVTYVYAGQYERQFMAGTVTPPGQVVYQTPEVTIYAVGGTLDE